MAPQKRAAEFVTFEQLTPKHQFTMEIGKDNKLAFLNVL
jgi:hypothetical protein